MITVPDAAYEARARRFLASNEYVDNSDPDFPNMGRNTNPHCPICGKKMCSRDRLTCLPGDVCRWQERVNERTMRQADTIRHRVSVLAEFDDEDIHLAERAVNAYRENGREIPGWLLRFLEIEDAAAPPNGPEQRMRSGSGSDAECEGLAGLTEDPSMMATDVP